MTEREMFERSFERSKGYFKLINSEQWSIDNKLGILDWKGQNLSVANIKRFEAHYDT